MRNIIYPVFIAISALCSCNTQLPELPEEPNKYRLTTVAQLEDVSHIQMIENFYATGLDGTFPGENDLPIYYKIFKQQHASRAAILISAGRTEAAIKYKELIFDLFNNGYSVYIHDHRGQGLSGRMTGDPEMGYVDSFQFYINDMKFFYDTYLKPNQHEKVYLIAHSMGGAIGMTYLEQFPDDFDAAAFSSPMLGLKSYVCPVARLVNSKEPKYGPGQSGYNREEEVFEGNTLTGSGVRYKRAVDAFDQVPQARLGGASIQWVQSSCRQFDDMFKHIGSIRTPFILFSAENEQVVNPHAHQKFVEKALQLGKECEAYLVKNARHELLVEKDEQRTGVINSSLNFFAKY